MKNYRPVGLIILDGWGIREKESGNAVSQAKTPNYDRWLAEYERAILDASGEEVGLPPDQMGNSEVGHLNLGAGRIVYQDLTRIDKAIRDGDFFANQTLQTAADHVRQQGSKLHLIGLLGSGGVHSSSRHLYALLEFAHRQGLEPMLHIITDGRDTPPQSGIHFLQELEMQLAKWGGVIGSVSGRYYIMDRDRRWPRIELAYRTVVQGEGERAATAAEAINQAYAAGVTDEFIKPTVIAAERETRIAAGDSLIFFNFRADRMRQIVRAFVRDDFNEFALADLPNLRVISMTQYANDLPTAVAFPEQEIVNPLAAVISQHGRKQFHAAETEKYAHVTYFFNGGEETPFDGEERLLVQSPKVATYDLQPEMSAPELADRVVQRIQQHDDDFILVNFANPDMVGHTGVMAAAVAACEAVDACADRVVQALLDKGGVALVTADHGNAERMMDEVSGGPHTYHTTNPVSFIMIGPDYFAPRPRGILADVAPTVLELLGVPQPAEMTGRSLLRHQGL
jgi:2,3-bisphosphoglycerate-independent phosphoglycerate mutase